MIRIFRPVLGLVFIMTAGCAMANGPQPAAARAPRIVNIYNFIRNSDFRITNSENILFETTRKQLELIEPTGLPATWALQYDALINPRYQKLLKEQAGTNDEIAAWWELPRPLVEKAGLKWLGGDHEWDPSANIGFSPGYTPVERRKLVDVYMADFKAVFGHYPKTVGSWYLDEVTMAYLVERYGIVAFCNCKDQVGTDFYTLWGGYWNQAYYPSRLNAYMPAQTRAGQIEAPVFRMLGSDPIYEHGTTPGLFSLEPVYKLAGGSAEWVAWFMDNLIHQPCLAFGYTQAGQENSFGWERMKKGLTLQVALLARQSQAGEIQVETLAQAGEWFRQHHALTPPTAVVALDDWKQEGRKTVWYDSRFYRLNVLWEKNAFFIRDLHCFDQSVVSPTHAIALTNDSLAYETLPVMDWALWRGAATAPVGIWPELLSTNNPASPMVPVGGPTVRELNETDLSISQPLEGGGAFSIVCAETGLTCLATNGDGQPLNWAWRLAGGPSQAAAVRKVSAKRISYEYNGTGYALQLAAGTCRQLGNGDLQLMPDRAGKLRLILKVR